MPPGQLQSAHAAAANASNLSFAKHTALVDRSTAAVGSLGLAEDTGANIASENVSELAISALGRKRGADTSAADKPEAEQTRRKRDKSRDEAEIAMELLRASAHRVLGQPAQDHPPGPYALGDGYSPTWSSPDDTRSLNWLVKECKLEGVVHSLAELYRGGKIATQIAEARLLSAAPLFHKLMAVTHAVGAVKKQVLEGPLKQLCMEWLEALGICPTLPAVGVHGDGTKPNPVHDQLLFLTGKQLRTMIATLTPQMLAQDVDMPDDKDAEKLGTAVCDSTEEVLARSLSRPGVLKHVQGVLDANEPLYVYVGHDGAVVKKGSTKGKVEAMETQVYCGFGTKEMRWTMTHIDTVMVWSSNDKPPQ